MANLGLYYLFLVILSFHFMTCNSADSAIVKNSDGGATNFIRLSCKATLYPALCFKSLSAYATKIQQNERQLAEAALSVSLAKARFTRIFVSKLTNVSGIRATEFRAVKDCVENLGDTIDQLSKSMKEMNQIRGGQDFIWHMSNVQTWVSAALTYENTCVDGFSGNFMEGNIKAAVKSRIVTVAHVTSNALALVNKFAEIH